MARNKARQPETPERVIAEKRRRAADRETVRAFLSRLVIMLLLLWALFGMIFGVTPMANEDMSPRISAGDLMLYYRLEKSYSSGDVVVLRKDGEQYTARVVAKGGDQVEITSDSQLRINGSTVIENDIFYKTAQYESDVTYPVILGEDEYFVLCDYREGAKDSRYYGAVTGAEIQGKVITVLRRSNL